VSILEIMKQKKKERLNVKHPFYDEDISFRFSYCVGNALLASVDNGINDIEKTALNNLGFAIGLSEDEIESVITSVKKIDSTVIDTIIDTFTEESHRFLFVLDLYRMAYQDGNLGSEEKEMIEIFTDLLNFSNEKKIFIEKLAQSVKEENHAKAQELVNSIQKQGIDIPMNVLGYFAPNLNIDIKSQEQEENFEEYSETIVNKQGNTLWNLRNGGLIAHQGDWIYYANPEDNNKLYKCKLDHSSKTKICADIVNSINAIGDWIYYIRDKKAIYKIKSNGTNKTEILFEEFSYIYVIKDWIYCVKTQSDMFGINSNTTVVKIKVDGSAREELSYVEDLIYIEENYIYYRNRFTKFYKLDTLNKKEILIGETKGAEHFGCSGPYVINEGHLFLEMEYHNRFLFTDQYSSLWSIYNPN